jgi:hypothetical protein
VDEGTEKVVTWLAWGLGLCVVGLGVGAGFNIALEVGVAGTAAAAIMTWLLVAALGCAVLLFVLYSSSRVLDAGTSRLRDPSASYAPFIGVVAALLTGLISKILDDDPFLAVAIALVAGFVSVLAAMLIRARPWIGVGVYVLVAAAIVILVVLTTSPREFEEWVDDRTGRGWFLLTATALTAIGVPTSVVLVERFRRHTAG